MIGDLVSILVPNYNAHDYVVETVSRALNQTHAPVEVVVVDDGSHDASVERLRAIDDPRLSVIEQANKGAAAARNAAFAASRGQFVMYLDADDLIESGHVAALRAAIIDDQRDVGAGKWDRFYQDPAEALFPDRETYQSLPGPKWTLLDWDSVNMTQCGMFLIPRGMVERLGGWDERLSVGPNDDFEFFARILANCDYVRFAPDARLYYRSGLAGSLSSRQKEFRSAEAQLLSVRLGVGHMTGHLESVEARRTCANLFQHFDFQHYPFHPGLRRIARELAATFGGADVEPVGPPGFHRARNVVGWKAARLIQIAAELLSLNGAGRRTAASTLRVN